MKGIGEGIAFAAIVAGTVWLEINGKPVTGLWVLIVCWALISNWGKVR